MVNQQGRGVFVSHFKRQNAIMIQITQTRLRPASEAQLDRWRTEFAEKHCIVLPQLIEPALWRRLWHQIENSTFERKAYARTREGEEFAIEVTIHQRSMATHMLQMLFNHSKLFEMIRQITDCPPIGGFNGRIYRMLPGTDHHLDWHTDTHTRNYLVGISINLGPEPYSGGLFQIRDRYSKRITGEVMHHAPGDAHLFSIAPRLQHRLTPLTGSVPRTAGAGWFSVESRYLTALKHRSWRSQLLPSAKVTEKPNDDSSHSSRC